MTYSEYLSQNTTLSDSSIYHYMNGFSVISKLAFTEGLSDKPLEELTVPELELVFELLRNDENFKKKDSVGKRMYSNSVRHYISFKKSLAEEYNYTKIEKEIMQNKLLTETEKEALIKSRRGQGLFREKLFTKYGGRCLITGSDDKRLLVASHIKPWAVCKNDERLDVENGLLLSILYDKLFDLGIISFSDNGELLISKTLRENNIQKLNITNQRKFNIIPSDVLHRNLEYHRDVIFLK